MFNTQHSMLNVQIHFREAKIGGGEGNRTPVQT